MGFGLVPSENPPKREQNRAPLGPKQLKTRPLSAQNTLIAGEFLDVWQHPPFTQRKDVKKPMKLGTKVVPLWALALIAITSISTAVGVLIVTRTINQSGIIVSVKDFQVYSDAECTVILTAHDWGELHRSEVKELVFYGKNLGEEDLYLYWSDTAPTDVTFTMFRVNDA
jgi:hypothetical protein